MPKMKTNKGIAKRVKITGTGKVLGHKTGAGHLKSRKTPAQLRNMRKEHEISKAFSKHVKAMLGGV